MQFMHFSKEIKGLKAKIKRDCVKNRSEWISYPQYHGEIVSEIIGSVIKYPS